MEELLAYSLLLCEGLASESDYQNCLDTLFLKNPTNADLLELELMSRKLKESIFYICNYYSCHDLDADAFGLVLMRELKKQYRTMELSLFSRKMYLLWNSLPECLQEKEPFWTLVYADEPLTWGDETQTRALIEKMLDYYQ